LVSRFTIELPLPPSSNNIYYTDPRTNTRHLTKEAKSYKRSVEELLMKTGARHKAPAPPFSMHYHFRFKTRHKRDLSNGVKLAEDAIVKYLNTDDRYVYDLHLWKYIDKANPALVVEIRESTRTLDV